MEEMSDYLGEFQFFLVAKTETTYCFCDEGLLCVVSCFDPFLCSSNWSRFSGVASVFASNMGDHFERAFWRAFDVFEAVGS